MDLEAGEIAARRALRPSALATPARVGPRRRRGRAALAAVAWPGLVLLVAVGAWHLAVRATDHRILPTPAEVVAGVVALAADGLLFKYILASLYRVTIGFCLAALVGIPAGLAFGWFAPLGRAFNPLIQLLRPISPIAWIPLAILWFGVDDRAPIFLIFLASVFPLMVAAAAAVRNIPPVYLRAARNFELSGLRLFREVILPATLPQLITGVRIAIGISWLVVVAAEMIAVNSGLGYLIIDARNAGRRYDLVVAGMLLIGLVGLGLDAAARKLERLDSVRWGISDREGT